MLADGREGAGQKPKLQPEVDSGIGSYSLKGKLP